MEKSSSYYKIHSEKYHSEARSLYKRMTLLSSLRLLVFLITGIGIYITFSKWEIAVVIGVLGVILFIYLLSKHSDTKSRRDLFLALVKINTEEIDIASGKFHDRDSGTQFQDPTHFYSLDIDLYGRGSFFQFINRTTISEGTQKLANELMANNIEGIVQRQEAIKELSSKSKWRQYYSATSSLISVETKAQKIIDWLHSHQPFISKQLVWIPALFSAISGLLFLLVISQSISPEYLGYWLLLGLGITAFFVKRINVLSHNTEKVKDTFKQYALLLNQIESETFSSALLQKKQQDIEAEHKKASVIFSQFSKHLDSLDNRNNMISAIFGNGLFLSDIKNAMQIEKWISRYNTTVEHWFEIVSFFDAYNSLGNYAFNHSDYVYPEIQSQATAINSTELGHPLLNDAKRIDNDFKIDHQQFYIITGANMAGKSTFLRTVSLQIIMANIGLPVCAQSSIYSPVKLITSMRTSDSLTDDSSYFFSELTRLKFIVDAIQNDSYFIVLDEILKGTNSTDKAIGSKKFVEKLVASNATGIIATHDLSLCEIESKLPEVKNYFFDAEIINDELHFDYTFKKGICQNMNASFLLKKMNIV
ncbi:DNA mismatch repair protein MutS [Flavobacteriales bacterium 34_180_T64]|nr:DNA mismatch repair protein MutS [Flavobacteriales bacterium 34_180_T64]